MTALHIVQVQIDDSSNKTITGIWEFDYANGGHLLLPSGPVLPTTGTLANEIFLLTTTSEIYVRDATNTNWITPSSSMAATASFALTSSLAYFAFTSSLAFNAFTASFVPGGTTDTNHPALRQLVHLADGGGPFESFASGATLEIGPQPFPTSSIWRTVDNKKIVEKTITRNSSQIPTTIQWQAFDVDGVTVVATVTDTITYTNNVFETGRTRAIS